MAVPQRVPYKTERAGGGARRRGRVLEGKVDRGLFFVRIYRNLISREWRHGTYIQTRGAVFFLLVCVCVCFFLLVAQRWDFFFQISHFLFSCFPPFFFWLYCTCCYPAFVSYFLFSFSLFLFSLFFLFLFVLTDCFECYICKVSVYLCAIYIPIYVYVHPRYTKWGEHRMKRLFVVSVSCFLFFCSCSASASSCGYLR